MTNPSTLTPLPPMPLWLRVLGVVVCCLPPVVYTADLFLESASPQKAIGSFVYTLIIGGIVFLFLLAPRMATRSTRWLDPARSTTRPALPADRPQR